MKKKGLIVALSVVGAIILFAAIVAGVLLLSGNNVTTARCIVTDDGTLYMVCDERPIQLNYGKETDFKTGDKLLIVYSTAFAESYPEQTRAAFIVKLSGGTARDVPQRAFDVLYSLGDGLSGKALDFRITQNVENYSFEGFDEIYGWFGAREYLGRGYKKIAGPNGEESKPKHYVSYLVTAYPDYADGGAYITEICITDPEVRLYGLTVGSPLAEFDAVFTEMGFTLSDDSTTGAVIRVAEKDGIRCTLTYPKPDAEDVLPTLVIRAEVTNRTGIVY